MSHTTFGINTDMNEFMMENVKIVYNKLFKDLKPTN